MPLRRFRRQYEQLSQFERGRIVGMMEPEWSARRVARQLGCSDCVVRRCWDQWIREMSFTRRPGLRSPRQTSRRQKNKRWNDKRVEIGEGSQGYHDFLKPVFTKDSKPFGKRKTSLGHLGIMTPVLSLRSREDHHIVRNKRLQPTVSSPAIQAHVAPSLGAPMSSRKIRKRLAEGHLESGRPLSTLPLTPTYRRLRLDWCHARENWTAAEWNQVVFSDEFRFNLSSDDNRIRVWRPRSLNSAFALQRHTDPTAGARVWGVIAYNTRSLLVLIRGTMTAQRYVHDILQPHMLPLMQRLPGAFFSTRQCSTSHGKGVTRLSPHCYYPSLACPTPRFVSNRAYL
ncbi:transposable element Tcb2 transposase [Trichonephila clavipes]|nr:transposable element Tcb2 transposase [Trichonephila clavipes]